jgi:hypothetical protein
MTAASLDQGFELQEILIEMLKGVVLNLCSAVARCFVINELRQNANQCCIVVVNILTDYLPMLQVRRLIYCPFQKLLRRCAHAWASLARILAKWIAFTGDRFFRNTPSKCIRQLGSTDVTNSAPVALAFSDFVSPIAAEIIPNFTENVPPNPQQSSA